MAPQRIAKLGETTDQSQESNELEQGSHSPGKSGNYFGQGKSGNFVGGQGILVACERKLRFLSTFQGKVATR